MTDISSALHFLFTADTGSDEQPVRLAADKLVSLFATGRALELKDILVIAPSRRSCQRLLSVMTEEAEKRDMRFIPPVFATPADAPEHLYTTTGPLASRFERLLAWAEVLRVAGKDELSGLVPHPPRKHELAAWFRLAGHLDELRTSLVNEGFCFASARELIASQPFDHSDSRWDILASLEDGYLATLTRLGRHDIYEERRRVLEGELHHRFTNIVTCFTLDLPRGLRLLLEKASCITALVADGDESRDVYDHLGAVRSPMGRSAETIPAPEPFAVPLATYPSPDSLAEGVKREVTAVRREAADLPITVALCDRALIAPLSEALVESPVRSHFGGGLAFSLTPPGILLSQVQRFLETRALFDFGSLLRHPSVLSWCGGQLELSGPQMLSLLTRYHREHLVATLPDGLSVSGLPNDPGFFSLLGSARELLGELAGGERPFPEWIGPLVRFFSLCENATPQETVDVEENRDIAGLHLTQLWDRLYEILYELFPGEGELTQHGYRSLDGCTAVAAHEALRIILDAASSLSVPLDDWTRESVEILGWVELLADDARVVILAGPHAQALPEPVTRHHLLCPAARRILGLPDDTSRALRDRVALRALQRSKIVRAALCRIGAEGELLIPSPLLLGADPGKAAETLTQFMTASAPVNPGSAPAHEPPPSSVRPAFPVPPALPHREPPLTLSVTGLKDYLVCPYRYYLSHVLKLSPSSEDDAELPPPQFGSVAHEVLAIFGKSDIRDSTSEKHIAEFLQATLDETFHQKFGALTYPAVRLQREQLRERLQCFATWQAEWRSEGWEIQCIETPLLEPPLHATLASGTRVQFSGKVDRIDYHPGRKVWCVLDYKTADVPSEPRKEHITRDGQWLDLQLPLYSGWLRARTEGASVESGYVRLPAPLTEVNHILASWTPSELDDAWKTAIRIAERIVNGEFWPPRVLPPARDPYATLFRGICTALPSPDENATDRQSLRGSPAMAGEAQ